MMTRYTAAGVLADMRDGKSVIYFGSRAAGTELLADCVAMAGADEVARVARANGKERVDHRTGGSVRMVASPHGLRGALPDVLVLEVQKDADPRVWHEIQSVLAGGRTEIVRV